MTINTLEEVGDYYVYCGVNLLCHALADPGIGDQATNLAGNPLHALLGLHQGHVHVLHSLHHVASRGVI